MCTQKMKSIWDDTPQNMIPDSGCPSGDTSCWVGGPPVRTPWQSVQLCIGQSARPIATGSAEEPELLPTWSGTTRMTESAISPQGIEHVIDDTQQKLDFKIARSACQWFGDGDFGSITAQNGMTWLSATQSYIPGERGYSWSQNCSMLQVSTLKQEMALSALEVERLQSDFAQSSGTSQQLPQHIMDPSFKETAVESTAILPAGSSILGVTLFVFIFNFNM